MSEIYDKISVVLVDDDADDRMLFQEVFEELRIKSDLHLFKHGLDAVEYFQNPESDLPHIIFLDLNMPIMDGFEALEIVRKMERFRDVPIAIYSTSSATADKERTLIAGANIYITKPSEYKKLKELLDTVLKIQWQYHTSPLTMDNFVMVI